MLLLRIQKQARKVRSVELLFEIASELRARIPGA